MPEVGLSPVIIGHSNQLSVHLHAGATQPTQDPEPPCDEKGDQREEDQRNEACPVEAQPQQGCHQQHEAGDHSEQRRSIEIVGEVGPEEVGQNVVSQPMHGV